MSTEGGRGSSVKGVLLEVVLLWLVTNLLIRGVVGVHGALSLPDAVLAAVPFLFIYSPVLVCWLRGVDSYDYPLYVPGFRDLEAWRAGASAGLRWFAILLVPWLIAYHLWTTSLCGVVEGWLASTGFYSYVNICSEVDIALRLTPSMLTLIAFQVFFVAIPEEFFYRGYLQTRLDEVLPKGGRLLGVPVGWGLWISSILFAFGHSIVSVQWWHFAIFFPGVLFGLLREKTGGVLAPAFLHAACNVGVVLLDYTYGVRSVI